MRFFRGARSRFLVSCCNIDGKVFVLEQRGTSVSSRQVLDGASTGIAVSPRSRRVFAGYPNGVHVLDDRFRALPAEDYACEGGDVHDVKCDGDALLVVETSHNRVTAYTKPGAPAWSWAVSAGEGDRAHVNSLLKRDGGWLTSMFSPEGLGEPWRDRLDGAIMQIPADHSQGGAMLRRGLMHPHSLNEAEGALWFCESRLRRVMRVGFDGDAAPEVVAELPAYTRGLAITPDWILVGQSRSDAHFVRPLLEENKPLKDAGMCGVWFVSRHRDERFFVELPALEVYDIVELPD